MLIKKPADIAASEITPEKIYRSRRDFMQFSATMMGAAALGTFPEAQAKSSAEGLAADEELTPLAKVTGYNNFYELGTSKSDPKRFAKHLKTANWQVAVGGECKKPGVLTLEDFLKPHTSEERIYRLRCVEGWSMVIPWQGFSLSEVVKRFEPTGNAKYIEFKTLYDKQKPLPGQRRRVLDWAYVEGLRMDEAMNPLATLATGLYGEELPNQNGAPLRLVVPWKYGFKSIKSIVSINFVEKQPVSSWEKAAPREYGFYSNVNPEVDHPRWSQKKERRIGEFFKRDTLMFNGYAEQVAHLYQGMNLKKYY